MKVRLVLDGDKSEVMAIVGIALEGGVLDSMSVEDSLESEIEALVRPLNRKPFTKKTNKEYMRGFTEGRKVRLAYIKDDHKPELPARNSIGRVVAVRPAKLGRGAVVTVDFDEGGRHDVPASWLKFTR